MFCMNAFYIDSALTLMRLGLVNLIIGVMLFHACRARRMCTNSSMSF